jgi:hypothetical protein
LEGVPWVLKACRRKWSTTVIRRKGVTDIITAGKIASNESKTIICTGTLKDAEPFEGALEIPKRELGLWAAKVLTRMNAPAEN